MTVQPNTPAKPTVTNSRPVVLLRPIGGGVIEVDLDARRSTQSFHPALARVARTLEPLNPCWRDETPRTWRGGDDHGDRIDPRGGTAVCRCMHRLHLDAADIEDARETLSAAGYVVDVLTPLAQDHIVPDPTAPTEAATPGADPAAVGVVDPFTRCDAPMQRRYHDDAGRACGQRAYVTTAHRPTADGTGVLSWCAHHFREIAAPTHPFIVADSRHLLTTPYAG